MPPPLLLLLLSNTAAAADDDDDGAAAALQGFLSLGDKSRVDAQVYPIKRLCSKQKCHCVTNILNISTKPIPLCSSPLPPMSIQNFISSAINGRVCLIGYVIYSSGDPHCQQSVTCRINDIGK